MERTEAILAVAAILFAAFLLGFLAHWLVSRLSRLSQADLGEIERLAAALHEAEDARATAELERSDSEMRMRTRLVQAEAELQAAMDGLREARREAEELRAYLDRAQQGQG